MKDGGPAFPCTQMVEIMAMDPYDASGMTLRDYFAAHAPKAPEWFDRGDKKARYFRWRWFYADEMLKARGGS